MSPHDPQNAIFLVGLAAGSLPGRTLCRSRRRRPQGRAAAVWIGRRVIEFYCASLAQAGQLDEARVALDRLKELQPRHLDCMDRAKRSLSRRARWRNSSKACVRPGWNRPVGLRFGRQIPITRRTVDPGRELNGRPPQRLRATGGRTSGPASRVPAFRAFEPFRRARRAWRRETDEQRKGIPCRYTNTSISRARTSARSRSRN